MGEEVMSAKQHEAHPGPGSDEPRPRLLLYYPHGFSLRAWANSFAEGERPEGSHWGMHEASQHGFEVTSTSDSESAFWRTLCTRLTYRLLRFDLAHLLHNLHLLRQCDVVWALSEREVVAVVLAAVFRRGRRPQPVICGEMIWLNDEWPIYSRLRRMLLRRLLAKADALLIVTEGGARELRRILPDVVVQAYRFGIPSSVFAGVCRTSNLAEAVRSGRPARVLVAGNDLRRDWETVARALGGDKRFEVTMLSRREQVATYEAFGSNLRYVRAGQLRSLLEWYGWADIMVIASQPNRHGAGLTMLLEAAAVGIPLICSRTGDIDEYLAETCVTYVPPLDPEAMRTAAIALLNDPDAAARRAEHARWVVQRWDLESAAALERRCRVFRELLNGRRDREPAALDGGQELAGSEVAADP
jgi:glycosyltransferase involved in cell wall biosynthesis